MMASVRGMLALVLLACGVAEAQRWDGQRWKEVREVARHVWVSTDGDMLLGTSWDSGTAPAVKAVGTLTIDTQPTDTNTCTINGKVYTFQTTLTDVDGNVLIGASAATAKANLIAAINLGAGGGTAYATSMTLNADVVATDAGGNDMLATAKLPGTTANAYGTTETFTAGTNVWAGATLAGGSVTWASSDTVEFNGSTTTAPSSNVDLSDVVVDRVTVTPNETLDLGSGSAPIRFNIPASAGDFKGLIYRGTGTMYFGGAGTSSVWVDSINVQDALVLSNTVGSVLVKSGDVHITATATIVAASFLVVDGISAYVTYDATDAVFPHATCWLKSGQVDCNRPTALANLKTIIVSDGLWTQSKVFGAGNPIYLLGGTFRYTATAGTGGAALGVCLGGVLDSTQSKVGLTFGTFIQGQSLLDFGSPVGGGFFPAPTGLVANLRKEYP